MIRPILVDLCQEIFNRIPRENGSICRSQRQKNCKQNSEECSAPPVAMVRHAVLWPTPMTDFGVARFRATENLCMHKDKRKTSWI